MVCGKKSKTKRLEQKFTDLQETTNRIVNNYNIFLEELKRKDEKIEELMVMEKTMGDLNMRIQSEVENLRLKNKQLEKDTKKYRRRAHKFEKDNFLLAKALRKNYVKKENTLEIKSK